MKKIAKSLVVRPGTMKTWNGGKWASIYCKINLNERGHLSISGVIGPTQGGNALGSYGQIDMEFQHRNPEHDYNRYPSPIQPRDIRFRPGWTVGKWYTFLEYWKLYHLNGMKPGCEHQEAEGWGKKEIKLVKVKFQSWKYVGLKNYNTIKTNIERIDAVIARRLKKGHPVTTGMFRAATSGSHAYLQAKVKAFNGEVYSPDPGSAAATWIGDNKPIKITAETKTSGWIYPKDHPDGELAKPCKICGYKYGTAWNKQEVPRDVLNFLFTLPKADQAPPWV